MSEEPRGQRLPPPAFPPSTGRADDAASGGGARPAPFTGTPSEGDPTGPAAEADAPDPRGRGEADLAFISPDEPLPYRDFDLEEEGVATGIGDEAWHGRSIGVSDGDPALRDLVLAVTGLADGLRRKGRAALKATPSMTRFEATLRAYCVGYLAGRQAELAGEAGEGE